MLLIRSVKIRWATSFVSIKRVVINTFFQDYLFHPNVSSAICLWLFERIGRLGLECSLFKTTRGQHVAVGPLAPSFILLPNV